MTPEIEVPTAKPKPKRKPRKRAARAAPKPAATATAAFPGLTVTACATACSAEGCVVSGSFYCGHPRKGGLRGDEMHDTKAIDRVNSARKMLAGADADKRFS